MFAICVLSKDMKTIFKINSDIVDKGDAVWFFYKYFAVSNNGIYVLGSKESFNNGCLKLNSNRKNQR